MSGTVVIDGNNLAMRSLFAMRGHQTVLSSHGENTGPLLVFARMLDRYARFTQPDKLVVCWDSGESWRQMVDDGYKANRPAKPDDDESEKRETFALVKRWLSLSNVFTFSLLNYEADDLIAGFARGSAKSGEKVWIISGDKDLLQMVEGDSIVQIRPTSGMSPSEELWDEARVLEKFGASRRELTLMNCLTGDTSDNIPGLSGIGPKRAATLVQASRGLVSELVENERCREHRDRIYTNLTLMDLRDPPLRPPLPRLPEFRPTSHESIGWPALQGFLREYQLASLLEMVIGLGGE